MSDQPKPPPGWYAHPEMADTLGYWDGAHWTEQVAPAAGRTAAPQKAASDDSLVVGGWITAVLIPIVGFVAGCVLLSRRPGIGIGIMAASLVSAMLWWQYVL